MYYYLSWLLGQVDPGYLRSSPNRKQLYFIFVYLSGKCEQRFCPLFVSCTCKSCIFPLMGCGNSGIITFLHEIIKNVLTWFSTTFYQTRWKRSDPFNHDICNVHVNQTTLEMYYNRFCFIINCTSDILKGKCYHSVYNIGKIAENWNIEEWWYFDIELKLCRHLNKIE